MYVRSIQFFEYSICLLRLWRSCHQIFDIPSLSTQPFEARLEHLKKLFAPGTGSYASDKVIIVEQEKAKSRKHVLDKLKEIESLGGEGLMLRKPGSLYEGKRSSTLLKIKVSKIKRSFLRCALWNSFSRFLVILRRRGSSNWLQTWQRTKCRCHWSAEV